MVGLSLFHKHSFKEQIGGLYADEENGPRTYHEIWWECPCGKVLDPDAKARSRYVEAKNIVAIVPRRYIYG